jgi:hypothetical protein
LNIVRAKNGGQNEEHELNIGETIVSDYLKIVEGCDFVDLNVYTKDIQGEIDVVGLNNEGKKIFLCEVAIHLTSGLRYVKNKRPNTYNKLMDKFRKDITYARKYFPKYEHVFMLWSPIVKKQNGKERQLETVHRIQKDLKNELGVEIQLFVNSEFRSAFEKLKTHAGKATEELKSPVLRLLQIDKRTEHYK